MHILLKKVELIFILFIKPECKFFLRIDGSDIPTELSDHDLFQLAISKINESQWEDEKPEEDFKNKATSKTKVLVNLDSLGDEEYEVSMVELFTQF